MFVIACDILIIGNIPDSSDFDAAKVWLLLWSVWRWLYKSIHSFSDN